jgi:hypothetical protein
VTDPDPDPAGGPPAADSGDPLSRALSTLAKVLGVVVTIVTLLGGLVALLFQVDPTLLPCVGGSGAAFTDIQVFPGYDYTRYVLDLGIHVNYANSKGTEVRYGYQVNNLSGASLTVKGTLQQIAPDGDITYPRLGGFDSVVYEQRTNLAPGFGNLRARLTPNRCSQDGSGIYWMQMPSQVPRHHRYRIVLELYRGSTLEQRVGVGVTQIFDQ